MKSESEEVTDMNDVKLKQKLKRVEGEVGGD